jgi:hypothetical protein
MLQPIDASSRGNFDISLEDRQFDYFSKIGQRQLSISRGGQ